MSFEDLKGILAKFLNPDLEEEEEVEEEATTPAPAPKNDLPWEDEDEEEVVEPKKNYTLQAKTKATKADKFDALFADDEDEDTKVPF
jgi:hypothetical protein